MGRRGLGRRKRKRRRPPEEWYNGGYPERKGDEACDFKRLWWGLFL